MRAIVGVSVSKRFKIPHEKKTTLFQNLVGLVKRQFNYEEFWALKDVSFEVERGETFGIIGRNASGKTTLLKMVAKVLYPDSGRVEANGRVAPFLELGVGFQPELSAEENVYIYSSILGMSRRETRKKYDEIFDFAELKRFENMKLKNFSSGMYLRLAFSTALYANPDIMLIDEVLAVGDDAFQRKCLARITEFQGQRGTIVLVSHNMEAVKQMCKRSMFLDNGTIASIGESDKVIGAYLAALEGGTR